MPQGVVNVGKSMGAALVLTFFFGPLGLFYATVFGGLIMLMLGAIVGLFTFGLGTFFVWPLCMVWAAIAIERHNRRLVDPSVPPVAPTPVLAAIAALVLGATVGTAVYVSRSASSKPETKAGWTRESPSGQGFSVGLPPGWTSVSTKSADDAFNSLKAANPELANLVKDQLGSSLASLIKLLAFDVQSPTLAQQFATNMNVVVAPTGTGVTFDAFLQLNLAELRKTPGLGNTLRSENVNLPAGRSAKVTSQLTVNAPGGQQTVAITQYLLVSASRGYIISFSTLPSHVGSYTSLFQEIAETFRFV